MNLEAFLERLEGVRQSGGQYVAQCPAHPDKRQSLSVSQGDDGRVLVCCHAGCTTADVCGSLELSITDLMPERAPGGNGNGNGKPHIVATYPYHDAEGNVAYEVVRMVPKSFRQRRPVDGGYAWGLNGGEYALGRNGDWYRPNERTSADAKRVALKTQPRLLYRLPQVISAIDDGETIYVVEGEKDVQSCESLGLVATTNSGGADKWDKSFTQILSRATRVVLLPDNDGPGRKHAARIADMLPRAVVVYLPDLPEKGDVTDWIQSGGTREALEALAEQAESAPAPAPEPVAKASSAPTQQPFTALGHNHGTLYFIGQRTGQVQECTPQGLNKANLIGLAPLMYWENTYGSERGVPWLAVADALLEQCSDAGVFDPARIRGRGAWLDAGRTVIHHGDHLVVDGATTQLSGFKSEYTYPAQSKLAFADEEPATAEEATQLYRLIECLRWRSPVSAYLLSGWLAIAPVCGVLAWRPHIWVTGGSGSGKSWTVDNIICRALGPTSLNVLSGTTEPGIRQALGCDARPVVFDEAEGEDTRTQSNIDRVLELARQASSDGSAAIMKGSANGQAMHYRVRSTFCWSSIGVGVRRRADQTRVTVLELREPEGSQKERAEHFAALRALHKATLSPAQSKRLVARSCRLASVIREAADVFADAVDAHLGSRRLGDQLGALLAGHWTLCNDSPPSAKQAAGLVMSLDWDEYVPNETDTDEAACIGYLLDQRVRHEPPDGKPTVERSIGELLQAWHLSRIPTDVAAADDTLRRHGIAPDNTCIHVSTCHAALRKLLENTPWATDWARYLARLPGAERPRTTRRFAGRATRVVKIPMAALEGEKEKAAQQAKRPAEAPSYDREEEEALF